MDDSILDIFNNFKTILCMCPKCKSLMRLSDLHLKAKMPAPKTWLDTYESRIDTIEKREDLFDQQKSKIREKSIERGRAKVPILVKKSMSKQFTKLNYDPYDIKAILHPIDFVVFNGMNKDAMKDVVLLSRKTSNRYIETLHKGIEKAVNEKSYDWKVVRVSAEGDVKYE